MALFILKTLPLFVLSTVMAQGFPGGSVVKNLPANAGGTRDVGSIPGSGRLSAEGNGKPL